MNQVRKDLRVGLKAAVVVFLVVAAIWFGIVCYKLASDLQRVDKLSTVPGNRVPGYF